LRKQRARRVACSTAQRSIVLKTFVSTTIRELTLLPEVMFRTMFRGKGLKGGKAPPSRFSGYQGEASLATSWVHKPDHRDSWPPHPLQASLIVRLRLPSRSPLRGALSLFPLRGGFDQSLISSHSRSRTPFFLCPYYSINLVLIPPFIHTNRRRTLRSTTFTTASHVALTSA
jgi:hypothetical protein